MPHPHAPAPANDQRPYPAPFGTSQVGGRARFGAAELRFDVFPWALVRTPGLPAAALRPLADEPAFAAVDDLLADRDVADLADEFKTLLLPAARANAVAAGRRADLSRLSRAARTVDRGEPLSPAQLAAWLANGDRGFADRWQAAVARRAEAAEGSERAHDAAVRAGRAYLAARCREPDVAHAVFLSSRDFFDHAFARLVLRGEPARDEHRDRQVFATAARYLRRLCVRCELTSFFGPVHWVRLDPDEPRGVAFGAPGEETILVEPSVWLIDELNRAAQRDLPTGQRRPRRHPLVREVDGRLVRVTDGEPLPAGAEAIALWRRLDGATTVARAVRDAGLPGERGPALLRELSGAVVPFEAIPAHEPGAFAAVLARSRPDGPAHDLELARREFEATPWPRRQEAFDRAERIAATLGGGARRGSGRHYVDRYVFHEERTHPRSARTVLGAPAAAGLCRALEALLPLSMLAALVQREDARQAVRAAVGGRRIALFDLLRMEIPAAHQRTTAFLAALADLVRQRVSGEQARLTAADIADLVDRYCPPLDASDNYATLAGPDMMVLGDPAVAPWLLSELHDDGSYLGGGVSRLHPDGAALRAQLLGGVATVIDPDRMAAVVARRRNKFLVPEMPGVSVELTGMSGKPRAETVPISEVTVEPDGTALRVGGRRVQLYTGDIPSVQHRALAVPSLNPVTVDLGAYTPRILVGDTVLARARWRVELPPPAGGYQGWLLLHRIRRRAGLPRRVFVRHGGEQKPLFVDFADPYSVADLARLGPGEVVVSEMLPEMDQLWWRPDGAETCAELRTACLVRLYHDNG